MVVEECKCAFVTMMVGVLLVTASMLMVILGAKDHFGYLSKYPNLTLVVSFSIGMLGAVLAGAYVKCLLKLNGYIK